MASYNIQLVDKDDFTAQKVTSVALPQPAQPPPGAVIAQTCLIGLTTNNTSYARGGRVLHWWDAYPPPTGVPDESDQYGLVPGWGYGKVVRSGIEALPPGELLWGYWPFHKAPVELQLELHPFGSAASGDGYWIETSSHRQAMMTFYNRYSHVAGGLPEPSPELDAMAWRANLRALWESGFLLSRFVWPAEAPLKREEQVHVFGAGLPWTHEDGDASSTVFIVLGGSGRTAMCFAGEMRARAEADRPAGMIAITSARSMRQVKRSGFFDAVLEYAEAEDTAKLRRAVSDFPSQPKRVVLLDVAGRGDSCSKAYDELRGHVDAVTVVRVGGQMKTLTQEEQQATTERATQMGALQMNASGIRDDAVKKIGDARYAEESERAWEAFTQRGRLPGMRLKWGRGVVGDEGVEGGWRRLCAGEVGQDEALVYAL